MQKRRGFPKSGFTAHGQSFARRLNNIPAIEAFVVYDKEPHNSAERGLHVVHVNHESVTITYYDDGEKQKYKLSARIHTSGNDIVSALRQHFAGEFIENSPDTEPQGASPDGPAQQENPSMPEPQPENIDPQELMKLGETIVSINELLQPEREKAKKLGLQLVMEGGKIVIRRAT